MSILSKAKSAVKKALGDIKDNRGAWDMSDRDNRERTIQTDYEWFKSQRQEHTARWKRNGDYYNNKHVSSLELQKMLDEKGIPWTPAIIPDPYIHVESQIDPNIPGFEFNGRDDDLDSAKAKQREYVVKYVLDNNDMEEMNSENERSLGINGNAFWKVAWNSDMSGPGYRGNIEIGNPDCANFFNDPSAYDIDDGECHIFAYRMHKRKAARTFARELAKIGKSISEIGQDANQGDTEIYNHITRDINDDTLQIIEYWFRQPSYGSETMEVEVNGEIIKQRVDWEPGDIACSICINYHEVKYIPKYWVKTGRQNKHFPFVKYCRIPVKKSFWDKAEIDPIVELVDSSDRTLAMSLLNDAFMANDVIVVEEHALVEGSDVTNTPGDKIRVKDGKVNSVRRLGGLSSLNGGLKDTVNFIREIIKQTVGNFDVNMGDAPPGNVRTLGGLVELKEQGNKRQNIKKADRKAGFARLYELIDWTALEFYDDNRVIFIGADKVDNYEQDPATGKMVKKPVIFNFNSDNMRILDADMTDGAGEAQYYYPCVDAKIDVGDDIQNSKAMTLMATENLLNKPITAQNWKLVAELLDVMGLPNRQELKDWLEQTFGQAQTGGKMPQITPEELMAGLNPEEQSYLQEHPEVLDDMMGGDPNAMPSL